MNLTDQDMEVVVKVAIDQKKCMGLHLRHNKITAIGASILAHGLQGSRCLKSLALDGNRILDAGVQSLAKALSDEDSCFRFLHLNAVGMTDAGCDYLAEMMRANPWLFYLYLKNNDIGDRGVRVLCEALRSSNCGVTMITLSGNKLLTDASVDPLSAAMKANHCFNQVHLSDCSLSPAGQERLRVAAQQRTDFIIHL